MLEMARRTQALHQPGKFSHCVEVIEEQRIGIATTLGEASLGEFRALVKRALGRQCLAGSCDLQLRLNDPSAPVANIVTLPIAVSHGLHVFAIGGA